MRIESAVHYRSPRNQGKLDLSCDKIVDGEVMEGALISAEGDQYPILAGIPVLLPTEELAAIERLTSVEYDRIADTVYDAAMDWQFSAFLESEDKVREEMVDLLALRPGMRVLEIGCGTGRDSFRLARRLSGGELHMQDISSAMVKSCVNRMSGESHFSSSGCNFEFAVSSATALPYPENYFDAVFHFGGFNQFGDLYKGAAEMARVTRPNGRILFGDEGVAPWLKGSEFDGIVTANNSLFRANIPLHVLPPSARRVEARWIIANCFYVITFEKGEGTPALNLDLEHKGWRGGSLRTRYFGALEGVTPETKALVRSAAERDGKSVHRWLDDLIRNAAEKSMQR